MLVKRSNSTFWLFGLVLSVIVAGGINARVPAVRIDEPLEHESERAYNVGAEELGNATLDHSQFARNTLYTASEQSGAADFSVIRARGLQETLSIAPLATDNLLNGQEISALTLLNQQTPVVALKKSTGDGNTILLLEKSGTSVIGNTDQLFDSSNTLLANIDSLLVVALAASSDTIFAAVPPANGSFGADGSGFIRLKKSADGTSLRVQGLTGLVGDDIAYRLHTRAPHLFADTPVVSIRAVYCGNAAAAIGQGVTMVWDEYLKRLFVGLTGVTGKNSTPGALCGLLVGLVDSKNQLLLQTPLEVPQLDELLIPSKTDRYGIGYISVTDATQQDCLLFHLGVMHTSTGRHYLIANGGVATVGDAVSNRTRLGNVFALPLVATGDSDTVGLIADRDTQTVPISTADQMPRIDRPEAMVGVDVAYLDHGAVAGIAIQQMQVVGDQVFVSVAGARTADDPQEQGIFESRALFDADGFIRAWTPWSRVMGRIEPAFGFGIDEATQRVTYITTSNTTPDLMSMTVWDGGDFLTRDQSGIHNGLPLSTAFDGSQQGTEKFGRIYGLFPFDDETPGFAPYQRDNEFPYFSMMVATGDSKVALIEAGSRSLASGAILFEQTEGFITQELALSGADETITLNDARVFIKSCPGLGPIEAAEVARIADVSGADHPGWLFVGGQGGVAVLSRFDSSVGKGWDDQPFGGLAFLDAGGFPGLDSWSFKPLKLYNNPDAFLNTKKILSDGRFLYIITSTKVWRIRMVANGFAGGFLVGPNQTTCIADLTSVAEGNTTPFAGQTFVDGLIVDRTKNAARLMLMTSAGVWVNSVPLRDDGRAVGGALPLPGLLWTTKLISYDNLTSFSLGRVSASTFYPGQRGGSFPQHGNGVNFAQGNLYITAEDGSTTAPTRNVYRFDVAGGQIHAFKEPYFNGPLDELHRTPFFYRIGTVSPTAVGKDDGQLSENFQGLPILPYASSFLHANQPASMIDLKHKGLSRTINRLPLTRDPGSGAQYIGGTFGVVVNE